MVIVNVMGRVGAQRTPTRFFYINLSLKYIDRLKIARVAFGIGRHRHRKDIINSSN